MRAGSYLKAISPLLSPFKSNHVLDFSPSCKALYLYPCLEFTVSLIIEVINTFTSSIILIS